MFHLIKTPKIPLFFGGIILILGAIASTTISKESTPYIEYGVVNISTAYPGAGAEDVDISVTQKIENKIKSISGIDTMSSVSKDGFSNITLTLETSAKTSEVVSDLRSAVDEAKAELPSDLDSDPRVAEFDSTGDRPFLKIALVSENSKKTPVELSEIGEDFQKKLEKISGVASVSIEGEINSEVKILLQKNKLESFNISYSQVLSEISNAERNTPLGSFSKGNQEYSLRFQGESVSVEDLEHIIIGKLGTGTSVKAIHLSDIAEISIAAKDDMPISRFFNGKKIQEAIVIKVARSGGGDIFATEKKVKELSNKYFSDPEFADITPTFYAESTRQMTKDYQNLINSFLFSLVIVLLSIFFFIGVKEGLVAATVIPLSFLGTIFVLFLMGQTLNIMTNFAMILALGILVDTAIVIVEGTALYIKKGYTPQEAAIQSFIEFRAPLFAGMLTTLVVFLPLFFLPGVIGKFLSFIPVTVTIVLSIALLVSLYIIPALSGVIMKPTPIQQHSLRNKIETTIDRVIEKYGNILEKILFSQVLKVLIFLFTFFLFVATLFLPSKFEMFPTADSDSISISLELPIGNETQTTDKELQKIEAFVATLPEVEMFKTQVEKNTANISIQLIPFKDREKENMRTSVSLKEVLQKEFSNLPSHLVFQVQEAKKGPPQNFPVGFRVQVENISQIEEAKDITRQVTEILRSADGTQGVNNSISETPGEFRFLLDREKAFLKGINPSSIPSLVRGSVYGSVVSTFRNKGEDIDIRVQVDPKDLSSIEDILSLKVKDTIPLSDVIDIEQKNALAEITRYEGDIVFTISAFLEKGANAQEITNSVNTLLEEKISTQELQIPEGISIQDASENKENEDLINTMKVAFVMAILLMFFILVVQFQSYAPPLLVLQTVVFAQIGVSIGLYITGTDKSLSYMLGLISLSGIVVNDAIILVDKIRTNIMSKNFPTKIASVLDAGRTRFIPVVLTTLTTSAGIIPLIFIDSFWAGLAYTIIFGLSVSSLLTLFLIPIGYLLFQNPKKIKIPEL